MRSVVTADSSLGSNAPVRAGTQTGTPDGVKTGENAALLNRRQQLQQWVAAFGTPQQVAMRSRIVLAAAAGQPDSAIARDLDINRNTVILWRTRFQQEGLDGLWEVAAGRGRKPTYDSEKIGEIIDATLRTKPKGMTQWSCRLMAASQGVSKSTINNIWQSHNLKPHRGKTFKLSRDSKFLEKLRMW